MYSQNESKITFEGHFTSHFCGELAEPHIITSLPLSLDAFSPHASLSICPFFPILLCLYIILSRCICVISPVIFGRRRTVTQNKGN